MLDGLRGLLWSGGFEFWLALFILFLLGPVAILLGFFFGNDSLRKVKSLSDLASCSVVPKSGRAQAVHALFWALVLFTGLLMTSGLSPDDYAANVHRQVQKLDQAYPQALTVEVDHRVFQVFKLNWFSRWKQWLVFPARTLMISAKNSAQEDVTVLVTDDLDRYLGKTVPVLGCAELPCEFYVASDVRNQLITFENDPSLGISDAYQRRIIKALAIVLFGFCPLFGVFILYQMRREKRLRKKLLSILFKTSWRPFPQTSLQKQSLLMKLIPGQFFAHWALSQGRYRRVNYRPSRHSDDDYSGICIPLGESFLTSATVFIPNSLIQKIENEFKTPDIVPLRVQRDSLRDQKNIQKPDRKKAS